MMIVVEATLWPLIVIGAIPASDAAADMAGPFDEDLWSTRALRLALVVAGTGSRARVAHEELFRWLRRHKTTLWASTRRVAWIVEDDTMRSCAEAWLTLVDGRLFSGEAHTFRAFGPALSWLLDDARAQRVAGGTR